MREAHFSARGAYTDHPERLSPELFIILPENPLQQSLLIVQAVIRLWKSSVVDVITFALYIIILALSVCSTFLPFKVPTVVLVISAGVAGLLISLWKNRKNAEAQKGGDA